MLELRPSSFTNNERKITVKNKVRLILAVILLGLAPGSSAPLPSKPPFDYCQRPADTSPSPTAATTPSFEAMVDQPLKAGEITLENLVPRPQKDKFIVAVVAVGYDTTKKAVERLSYLVNGAQPLFEDVDMQFVYINQVVDITVDWDLPAKYESNPEAKQVFDRLSQFGVDALVFIAPFNDHRGKKNEYAIIDGENDWGTDWQDGIYALAHETGHFLGLTDGGERNFGSLETNTELFSFPDRLGILSRIAMSQLEPEVYPTGNNCRGQPVYRFEEKPGIMGAWHVDYEFESGLGFNRMQVHIMNLFIRYNPH